jgi:hypothetical protein
LGGAEVQVKKIWLISNPLIDYLLSALRTNEQTRRLVYRRAKNA